MAKITVYIPEPKEEYDVSNQRQVLEALDTVKNQLNLSFLFLSRNSCILLDRPKVEPCSL